jgi:hypothetical protein
LFRASGTPSPHPKRLLRSAALPHLLGLMHWPRNTVLACPSSACWCWEIQARGWFACGGACLCRPPVAARILAFDATPPELAVLPRRCTSCLDRLRRTPGWPPKGEELGENVIKNNITVSKRGTSAELRLARLKRDAPEFAATPHRQPDSSKPRPAASPRCSRSSSKTAGRLARPTFRRRDFSRCPAVPWPGPQRRAYRQDIRARFGRCAVAPRATRSIPPRSAPEPSDQVRALT